MNEQSSAIAETQGHRNLLVLLFAGFVLSGIATTIVGPMLPIFIRRWSLDDGQAGLFSTIQFLAELGGAKSASLLNQLNFAWGVGAMTCSVLIAFALKHNAISILLAATAIFGGILVVGLSFTSFGVQKHEKDVNATGAVSPAIGLGITIAMAAMFCIYVAMENGIGFWSAEYAKRVANGITYMTTLAPMFFYAGLTSGRAAAPLVLKTLHETKLVLGALSLEAAASVLLITSRRLPVATTALFLAGLGCASVYPIFIAWLSR